MRPMKATALTVLATLLLAAPASADPHDAMTPPDQVETAAAMAVEWTPGPGGLTSPLREASPATRVGILLTASPQVDLVLAARAPGGPWIPATQTWAGGDDQRIFVVDFPVPVAAAQVRITDATSIAALAWKLFEPVGEARRLPGTATERSPYLTQELRDIGVVAREDWGALPTDCTLLEDDWYRFAIHHTAGSQTSGGTVMGALQATQAWTMGGGGFCDVPYQFLVGYDGSLWEGRALNLFSGATGGGNNDGNIAVSLMGCYDVPGCSNGGQSAELVMIAATRTLVETLAAEHFITPTTDTLRGHREWPGNATACPGDQVLPRLPEIRSPTAHFEGELVGTSWGDTATIEVGETVLGWVDVRNVGLEIWGEGTRLAPLPRDAGSPLASDGWLSEGRISEPESDTSPSETARFPLELTGVAEGTSTLSLALVEEWVTWFEDGPIGGGPAAGDMILTVDVVPAEVPGDDDDATDDDDSGDPAALGDPPLFPDFERQDFAAEGVACACMETGSTGGGSLWGLLGLLALRNVRQRRLSVA